MRQRRGIKRFFVGGQQLRCEDCGEETIFSSGSLLGELPQRKTIREDMLHRLYGDCFAQSDLSYLCSKCDLIEDSLIFWLELKQENVIGPFCQSCFHSLVTEEYGGVADALEDAYIFYIRITEATQIALEELAAYFADQMGQEEQEEGTLILVDPRCLF